MCFEVACLRTGANVFKHRDGTVAAAGCLIPIFSLASALSTLSYLAVFQAIHVSLTGLDQGLRGIKGRNLALRLKNRPRHAYEVGSIAGSSRELTTISDPYYLTDSILIASAENSRNLPKI